MHTQKTIMLHTDIILVDIINFSQFESHKQLEIINFVTSIYKKMVQQMLQNSNMSLDKFILGIVSTGDGFYCILNPRLKGYGALLGLSFNHLSQEITKKFQNFRGMKIAVHTGEVYEFKDILGQKNFIGSGLHECSQYLDFDNYSTTTVMVSEYAYESLKKFLSIYEDFKTLLVQKDFKYSKQYTFKSHNFEEKKGTLIWLMQPGIINPPNINFNSAR